MLLFIVLERMVLLHTFIGVMRTQKIIYNGHVRYAIQKNTHNYNALHVFIGKISGAI